MDSGEILEGVVRQLRTQLGDAAADVELLTRYAQGRDEAAFASLVRRHGGLVLGVACRQLADRHEAEDVFQATFLALARSAPRLGRPASLANWLYTVALRLARKARLRAARRAAREQAAPRPAPSPDPLAEMTGRELVRVLDEELAQLPERYRQPLVLCGVQGLARDEAARQLGWSDGVFKGRLERGRRLLAARLARRGLGPSALALAPLAVAAVPGDLLASTAALAAAPWSPSLPAGVAALAAAPRRLLPAAVALGSLLAVGVAGLALRPAAEKPANAPPPPPAAARPGPAPLDDPLPPGSTLRFGTSRFHQGTVIERLAVSPDGKLAVAAGGIRWLSRGPARAFDLATGRVRYTLGLRLVEALAFSPDGTLLAARQDTSLHLFDARTGRGLGKIALPQANPRAMFGLLVFAPDGKTVAAASAEGNVVHLVDLDRGQVVRSFRHQQMVFAGAFSPDGKLLAADGYDQDGSKYFTRLWDVASGKELRRLAGGRGGLRSLAFSPDGKTLAGGGDSDGRLRLWDVATGQERRVFPADGTRIRSVAFTPDGRTVAAAGQSIRLYDPATGRERLHIDRQAVGLHFAADGKALTAAVGGVIGRWDAATGKPVTPQDAGDGAVDQILTTPDGRRLITHHETGEAHIWDAATGKRLRGLNMSWQRMALSPDGRLLAWLVADTAPHERSRIRLYDLDAGRQLDDFPASAGDGHCIFFGPDGKRLLTVDRGGGGVRLWDVAAGKELRTFQAVPAGGGPRRGTGSVWNSALSPDAKVLAVGYQPGMTNRTGGFGPVPVPVRLWGVATGKMLHELAGHANEVADLAFSPDGRLLVSCGGGGAFVWDVATGRRVPRLPAGLPGGAGSVAFSADGRTLATADGQIRLWEVATWTVRTTFQGHRDGVQALQFAADGRLYSGSQDTTVLAWDVRPARREDGALAAAWDGLAQPEAAAAFRAAGRLRADPAGAVALLAARLTPAEVIPAGRMAALIADLGSPKFATRRQATDALRRLGRRAESALRRVRDRSDSLEVRRRAGKLLEALEQPTPPPEELRALRAVEVLEWVGTPAARRLLAAFAGGAPDAPLTQAAGAALRRCSP
jgi:RNA polymerase sigma factor (sigma-70 family)